MSNRWIVEIPRRLWSAQDEFATHLPDPRDVAYERIVVEYDIDKVSEAYGAVHDFCMERGPGDKPHYMIVGWEMGVHLSLHYYLNMGVTNHTPGFPGYIDEVWTPSGMVKLLIDDQAEKNYVRVLPESRRAVVGGFPRSRSGRVVSRGDDAEPWLSWPTARGNDD